ncbi:MAG: hypothetical protein EAZ61_10035 [Oscillatoriales cyanobacterium]|nr:MAG: hypothetical protein EAZ61_10035 [Oscillatoriales cyanobacterium]
MDEDPSLSIGRPAVNFLGFFRVAALQQVARQIANHWRHRRRRFDTIAIVGIVAIAIGLRFWNLGEKALWLDEWLTLLIVNGYGAADLPLDRLLTFQDLAPVLQPHGGGSLSQTLAVLNRESTHPPLFFILQYYWLHGQLDRGLISIEQLPIALRTLPACLGILQTLLSFWVGRLAFSPRVGLLAAALSATSPLAIYLSQEARQYTLAMVCFSLALAGLLTVIKRWQYGDLRARKAVVLWIAANTLGLYSHYLFTLAFSAQGIAIALWLGRTQQWRKRRRCFTAIVPGLSLPLLFFSPWIWRLLHQVNRSETEWATPFNAHWFDAFAPIGQTLVALLSAFAALPLEGQPLMILVPLAVTILVFGLVLTVTTWQGWRRLQLVASLSPESARLQERRILVASITLAILAQMLAAFYLLGKNLTIAPRYHAIYYPSLCLIVAIGLGGHSAYRPQLAKALKHLPAFGTHWRRSLILGVISMGLIGSICVTQNWAFQKGYTPREIAADLLSDDRPTLTIAAYNNLQEIALNWSILWELGRHTAADHQSYFALLDRRQGYDHLWQTLADGFEPSTTDLSPTHGVKPTNPRALLTNHPDLTLWMIAPGLRQREFPREFPLADTHHCTLEPDTYQRVGIPYQGYRCLLNS